MLISYISARKAIFLRKANNYGNYTNKSVIDDFVMNRKNHDNMYKLYDIVNKVMYPDTAVDLTEHVNDLSRYILATDSYNDSYSTVTISRETINESKEKPNTSV